MKPYFFYLLIALLIPSLSLAQKDPYVFVFDSLDREVKSPDSVVRLKPGYYVRVIHEPDSGETLYKLSEYYSNKKTKRLGTLSSVNPLKFEGLVPEFDTLGRRLSTTTYEKGQPVGARFTFYLNGRVREHLEYFPAKSESRKYKLINYYSPEGNSWIEDGYGFMKAWNNDSTLYEEGRYVEGWRDSTWKFIDKENKYSRVEVYKKGVLVSGISTFENGSTFKYNKIEMQPEFPGGMDKFSSFIKRTFKYPAGVKKNGVTGRLIVSFVVEKDGSLSEIKVLRDLGMGLGEEAVHMLMKSPKWNPGIQNGRPVRVSFALPILI